MTEIKYPNKKAFKRVCADVAAGQELLLNHVGEVFGPVFWMMLVTALMSSQDAALAIQGAIRKLREENGNSSTT